VVCEPQPRAHGPGASLLEYAGAAWGYCKV